MKKTTLTIDNHKNCPKCGSSNTKQVIIRDACQCRCDCWSRPECMDCEYTGYLNSEGIYWNAEKVGDEIIFNERR